MRIHNRMVRAAVIVPVTLLSFVTTSCSVLFVSAPPSGHERMTYFTCTESNNMPIWDLVFAVVGVSLVLPTFAFGGSALLGFSKTMKCREARAEVAAALEVTYGMPEGLRPDVTLDVVGVTLDGSDTLHVGGTTRAHAAAFNHAGAEIRSRLFQWSSSDMGVAGVNGAGVVKATSAGIANISALTGGVAGTRRVVVVP